MARARLTLGGGVEQLLVGPKSLRREGFPIMPR
jgi:hypothetical protein